ncbi:Piso0_001334 [Millerozyma farinosa CBS 7064]|uniref:Piso0_001334 protein n=1 Tax=Pichia sorbitophila (strain ATCC MYA-4447 / BCRC 22081 / CBS 7064 / NBRC 10061 / NRRL Y-12695) TaxID=559304 RepID=G8YMW2_PICSO|nr:Piso0_001334 [Millerozyma farinosa CBS 7064]
MVLRKLRKSDDGSDSERSKHDSGSSRDSKDRGTRKHGFQHNHLPSDLGHDDQKTNMVEGSGEKDSKFYSRDTCSKLSDSSFSQRSKESRYRESSLFSDNKTASTNPSSWNNRDGFSRSGNKKNNVNESEQFLQILSIPEESLDEHQADQVIKDKVRQLQEDVTYLMGQYDNSLINLSTLVVNMIDRLKEFINFATDLHRRTASKWHISSFNNADVRQLLKIYLNLHDNLLKEEAYTRLKILLIRNFHDFSLTLDTDYSTNQINHIMKPQNFTIGEDGLILPNEDLLQKIIHNISASTKLVKEQNGSFIAPISRGISKNIRILCLYFGYKQPNDYHYKMAKKLSGLYEDIHVSVQKNWIETAATDCSSVPMTGQNESPPVTQHITKFKLPFRIPADPFSPPISMSLSVENSNRISGTLGGYIYPKINPKSHPHLQHYSNSKFALSCGHVCLANSKSKDDYPYVSCPSSVLISLYKRALQKQYENLEGENSGISSLDARAAYMTVLKQVDQMFPIKDVPSSDYPSYEKKNLPKQSFGQIVWGERTLINTNVTDRDGESEKRLSDLAIIKVNKNMKCSQNYLGDDISFNEFDPGLILDNLYVRSVINLQRNVNEFNINEVDSNASSNSNHVGLEVFKYGSTTRYTKGTLNGIKLVYWLDGAIQSSEFVIGSKDNNTAFASGGDSGAWILAKQENIGEGVKRKGLGVLGMLHSFDGEQKQFGLFTPMSEILDRLEVVTGIRWGVVGAHEKQATDFNDVEEIIEDSDFNSYESSDNDFENDKEEVC